MATSMQSQLLDTDLITVNKLTLIPETIGIMAETLNSIDITRHVNNLITKSNECMHQIDNLMDYELKELLKKKDVAMQQIESDENKHNMRSLASAISLSSDTVHRVKNMLLGTEELVHTLLDQCRLNELGQRQLATIKSAELQELQQTLKRLTTEEQNATYGNRRLQISRNNTENEDCKHRLCLTETQQIECKHFLDTHSIDMETFQRIYKQLVVLLNIIGQYIEIFQDEEVSLKELLYLSKTCALTLSLKQSFPDIKTKLDNKWDDFTKHVRDLEADGP